MPDQWEFMSHTYDNCNCSVSCGCQFNEPTTHGNCYFAYVGAVVQGHFNDTSLTGLNWGSFAYFPARSRRATASARSLSTSGRTRLSSGRRWRAAAEIAREPNWRESIGGNPTNGARKFNNHNRSESSRSCRYGRVLPTSSWSLPTRR